MSSVGVFGPGLGDPVLEAQLAISLGAVEQLLHDTVKSADPFVSEVARHLVEAGGKRFRAPRGTVRHARWDNTVAILTGDFLFARASDLLADLGPQAVRIQARTFERLVTGQIRETVGPAQGQDPLDHYLSVLADKTGSLIATSGRFGAMLSGADEQVVDILARFGERIGMAFQLADDLLDVESDAGDSGKTPGTDLREGVPTLPVFHVLRSNDPADAGLRELLSRPLTDDAEHAHALDLLRRHPAMESARAEVQRWADEARAVLGPLPEIPARAALERLCDAVVDRSS